MWIQVVAALAVALMCPDVTVSQERVTDPSNQVVAKGETVTVPCGIREADVGTVFAWRGLTVGESAVNGLSIFQNPPRATGTEPVSAHYAIEGSYNLQVLQTVMDDGGYYTCRLTNDDKTAVVLIFDKPQLTWSPDEIQHGRDANFSCSVMYAGPKYTIAPSNGVSVPTPTLRFTLNGVVGNIATDPMEFMPATEDLGEHKLMITGRMTATRMLHGNTLACEVSTADPAFTTSTSMTLDVFHYPYNITFSSDKDLFYVGDSINCAGSAHPAPEIKWRVISSPDPGLNEITGSKLTITDKMVGSNEWECIATSRGEESKRELIFIVDANPEPGEGTGAGGDSWKIAVGVVIPLVIIIIVIIVLVYFCWYKRLNKSNEDYPVSSDKPGVDNRANDVEEPKKPYAAQYQNQPVVNNNAEKTGMNPRSGPMVSTNPYPYPSHDQPKRSGRDSPGYADLGESQIRASNPELHLDVSFDQPATEGNHSFSIQPDAGYDNRMFKGSPQQHGRHPAPRQLHHEADPDTQV